MNRTLEERLNGLMFERPPLLVERALAAAGKRDIARQGRRGRPIAFAAAGAGVIVMGNLAVAAISPGYARVLADTPVAGVVAGRLLEYSGISIGDLTASNSVVVSSGHEVRLVAVHADGLRTVVYLEIDGEPYLRVNGAFDISEATLVDQYGETYQMIPLNAPGAIPFEPLRGEARMDAVELTLHISSLQLLEPDSRPISGNWDLHTVTEFNESREIAIPAPVHIAGLTYRITEIQEGTGLVRLSWEATGPLAEQAIATVYAAAPAAPGASRSPEQEVLWAAYEELNRIYFRPVITTEGGDIVRWVESQAGFRPGVTVDGNATVLIEEPGRYAVDFGAAEIWFEVP